MYTPEEVAAAKKTILDRVANGKSLEAVIREDVDMELPSISTVYGWMQEGSKSFDAQFLQDFARAYELRSIKIFEEMLDIADTPVQGVTTTIKPDGTEMKYADMVHHRTLQVNTRKWVLARMNSKRFGDKSTTVLEGGDKPIKTVDYSKLSPEFLEELAKQSDAGKTRSK